MNAHGTEGLAEDGDGGDGGEVSWDDALIEVEVEAAEEAAMAEGGVEVTLADDGPAEDDVGVGVGVPDAPAPAPAPTPLEG
jgi:hypothetical protein